MMDHADAGSGGDRVHLGDDARALDLGPQALGDLIEIIELGGEDQVVDIADDAVGEEVVRRRDRRHRIEIVARGVEAEPVVAELARHDLALLGRCERDRDVGLALRQRKQARHRDQLQLEPGIGLGQRRQARRQKRGAEAVGCADPDRARQRHVGAADLALDGERLGFHALGLGEQLLPMASQRVALGPALEQLGLE